MVGNIPAPNSTYFLQATDVKSLSPPQPSLFQVFEAYYQAIGSEEPTVESIVAKITLIAFPIFASLALLTDLIIALARFLYSKNLIEQTFHPSCMTHSNSNSSSHSENPDSLNRMAKIRSKENEFLEKFPLLEKQPEPSLIKDQISSSKKEIEIAPLIPSSLKTGLSPQIALSSPTQTTYSPPGFLPKDSDEKKRFLPKSPPFNKDQKVLADFGLPILGLFPPKEICEREQKKQGRIPYDSRDQEYNRWESKMTKLTMEMRKVYVSAPAKKVYLTEEDEKNDPTCTYSAYTDTAQEIWRHRI